jgi:tryptophan halogenase
MRTQKIAVVGGGTAGLLSALILKSRFPNKQVDIICSSTIGIIGVGEGSTEHWKSFMDFVGIDQYEMIRETDATIKAGIMFENWTEKPYAHSVQYPYNSKVSQNLIVFSQMMSDNANPLDICGKNSIDSKIQNAYFGDSKKFFSNQFHFNTNKLNDFLIKICTNKNINIIDDIITDVNLSDDGNVKSIIGNSTYEYDFYIDSTGFKRILMSKLGAKWNSHSKYLKMKSAIVFQLPEEEVLPMWTLSRAMDYGWLFRIPVYDRFGNGYIFDSDYITAEQAKKEVEAYFGKPIEVGKQITFDPGALENVWIKNCVAIGLSASFVEPLEASSIGTSVQQAFLLMHRLENYTDKVIQDYNKSCNDILINIRDFIVLHYLTKKDNTQFWKDVSSMELPETLKYKLESWKTKLPIREDFNNESEYILFTELNYAMVLYGIGLVNSGALKEEFNSFNDDIKQYVSKLLMHNHMKEHNSFYISHKEYLTKIRNI